MHMHPCDSTLISHYGYDPKREDLDINFHSGDLWRYSKVPEVEFHGFLRASSKGRYFLQNIKGKFDAVKR